MTGKMVAIVFRVWRFGVRGFGRGVDAGWGRAWEVDFRCNGFRFGD